MAFRSEIIRAFEELISNEAGMGFQALAVILVRQKYAAIAANEHHWDDGLDAYAKAQWDLQGRGIGLACSTTATLEKIRADAKKAKERHQDLRILIFATPAPVTNFTANKWAEAIRAELGLELQVLGREEFVTWLMDPANSKICEDQLGIRARDPGSEVDLNAILEKARKASTELASDWDRNYRKPWRPLVDLDAVVTDEEGKPLRGLTISSLAAELKEGMRVVLLAPAGNGKTVGLIQLANEINTSGGLALLVDMPEWIAYQKNILSLVTESPRFTSKNLDGAALVKLTGVQPITFLLNGWNEVSAISDSAAEVALRSLDRNFGAANIVVATRTSRYFPPLRDAIRVSLNPLSWEQRNKYLDASLNDSAAQLRAILDTNRDLDLITRTPLILAEVVDLHRANKQIPHTRVGVLRAVLGSLEESMRLRLQEPPLRGHAAEYLQALSIEMTEGGETAIIDEEARVVVNSVSEGLVDAKQINTKPDPGEVLTALTKHHVLVRLGSSDALSRFQHQQFQEFFAAGGLGTKLNELVREDDEALDREFLSAYINEPRWEESLLMLAEDIGAQTQLAPEGAKLVRLSSEVDLVFAAKLARLCGPAVWEQVKHDMNARLRAWYAEPTSGHKECALAAMFATGSADFKDIITPLLEHPNPQVRLSAFHDGVEVLPSSLGPNWREVVGQWSVEARLDFIVQLLRSPWNSEIAEQFASDDPSTTIKSNVARLLNYYGLTEKVVKLISSLGDEDFRTAILSFRPDEIPDGLTARTIEVYERVYEEATNLSARLGALSALKEVGGERIVERLKEDLDSPQNAGPSARDLGAVQWAVDLIRSSDPNWSREWLSKKAIRTRPSGEWAEVVDRLPTAERDRMLDTLTREPIDPNKERESVGLLARSADPTFAGAAFDKSTELRRSLSPEISQDPKWTLLRQVEGLLKAIDPGILLEGISARISGEPDPSTCGILAEVLATFHYAGEDRREPISSENKKKVHEYLKRSVSLACEPNRISASERAYLALLLSQVGGPEDVPEIRRLINADLDRVQAVHYARQRGERVGMPLSYSNMYVDSLSTAGGAGADDSLLELLCESEYERVVGEALIRRARASDGQRSGLFNSNRLNFPEIWAAREGKSGIQFIKERRQRYSAAIRERLEALRKENETAKKQEPIRYRIKQLATTLAVLDGRESAARIVDAYRVTDRFDGFNRVASLESLILAGVLLSHAEMMELLGPTIEEVQKDTSNNENKWILVRCLSLLVFTKEPKDGIKKVGEIVAGSRYFSFYGAEGLIDALGASRCEDAMELLMSLAGDDGSNLEQIREPWLNAVTRLGGQKSDAVLLSFVDPASTIFAKEVAPDYRDGDQLAQLLFQRAERNLAFKTRLFGLADRSDLTLRNRALLAKAYSLFEKDADALSGLQILRDESSGIPYEIYKSIENDFLERRPYGSTGNVFTIVPRSANAVRKTLFKMSVVDSARKRSAFELLGRIEEWRLRYGRPSDEPRHPDIESGGSWPPLFT